MNLLVSACTEEVAAMNSTDSKIGKKHLMRDPQDHQGAYFSKSNSLNLFSLAELLQSTAVQLDGTMLEAKEMSTKQKKQKRHTSIHIDPMDDLDANGQDISSNESSRLSRLQEKETLSGLNDRLATYIERVRNLEAENNRLHVHIHDVETVERKEKEDLTSRYEAKVADLRKQLDSAVRDKARMEIERSKAVDGYDDLKAKVAKFEKEIKSLEADRIRNYEAVQDLKVQFSRSENSRVAAEKSNDALKKELDNEIRALATMQRQLEDEVVLRTEAENKIAVLKEDLEFVRRTHNHQIEEIRRKRQVEMTSFSNEIETQYQAKLQQQLQNMRDDFDSRTAQNRAEMDSLYKSRIEEMNVSIEKLQKKIHDLESANAQLLSDYQDMLDLKVQMNTELQTYQKLLEGEETRLHITPTSSPADLSARSHVSFSDLSGSKRGTKRRRLARDDYEMVRRENIRSVYKKNSNASGDIVIDDLDREGRYVRLHNKGQEDASIGGWIVKVTGGEKEVAFKFHSRQVIKSGTSITLWSNNAEQEHAPPSNIVMKNQVWPVSDAVHAELLSDESVAKAWYEGVVENEYVEENPDDRYERCSIM